ncbi:conserved protein of unknown function [Pseudodesulfovibrio profundus]|uniref:Uncharacterized protein n=1 Tax=Pseudodesulfovibrio profundus TaxID=57320 RepID=A0A2C8F7Q6_9BACT|nr:hypothetical protein [Pseudodesulfovibrio profundus]SOB58153.1 conserved protein of unknown function [Pseudodesulfovibrio profundus]
MCDLWVSIGGVAVGVMVVTGVFVREEGEKFRFVEHDEDELEEEDNESGEESNDEKLIVREM